MISNVKEVVRICQKWLADYSHKNGVGFVVCAADDIASTATSMLCRVVNTSTVVCLPDMVLEEINKPKCILVGAVNRTNGLLNRLYFKRSHDGLADIYPVFDLYESELEQIIKYLNPNQEIPAPIEDREIVEWAIEENDRTGIISNDEIPTANEKWYGYSLAQKQILSELHQREKSTRHKVISGRPILYLRDANKNLF